MYKRQLLAFTLTALSFCIAWLMESTQGFHAIMNLFLLPMWMLSGALFPASGAPGWLRAVMAVLQDLGFIIERANEPLGLVTAARFAEPNYYDVMGITVTVRPQEGGKMLIRANAIYNNAPVSDPKVYQNFFATLERSLFIGRN